MARKVRRIQIGAGGATMQRQGRPGDAVLDEDDGRRSHGSNGRWEEVITAAACGP